MTSSNDYKRTPTQADEALRAATTAAAQGTAAQGTAAEEASSPGAASSQIGVSFPPSGTPSSEASTLSSEAAASSSPGDARVPSLQKRPARRTLAVAVAFLSVVLIAVSVTFLFSPAGEPEAQPSVPEPVEATAPETDAASEEAEPPASAEEPSDPPSETPTTSVPESSSTTSETSSSAPAPAPAPEAPATTSQPATVTVTVAVESSAVGSPVSGGTTATFEQGATVYDALMACGLSVNASSSPLGIYVGAIGGLAEKEHGGESGWKYYVNGVEEQTSCGNYVLKDGDSVIWRYTLSING